jgi:hypothetical protein
LGRRGRGREGQGPISRNIDAGANALSQKRATIRTTGNGISRMRNAETKLRAVGFMEQAQAAEAEIASRNGKLGRLIEHLKSMTERDFTGYVKINFTRGNIGRVEKFEEILRK